MRYDRRVITFELSYLPRVFLPFIRSGNTKTEQRKILCYKKQYESRVNQNRSFALAINCSESHAVTAGNISQFLPPKSLHSAQQYDPRREINIDHQTITTGLDRFVG